MPDRPGIRLLTIPPRVELTLGEMLQLPDSQVTIITTGSQAEPMSSLTRIARDDHKQIKIKKGDTVILSSRFIPGNEKAIDGLINNLYRFGAEVIYEKVSEIHVSGHANQEELKLMLHLTRPKFFIPIHGEYRHLVKHAQLAHKIGIPKENLILAENGQVIRFDQEGVPDRRSGGSGPGLCGWKRRGGCGQSDFKGQTPPFQ